MLGVHVAKNSHVLDGASMKRKTMLEALKLDVETLDLKSAQIYTHGPRSSHRNPMDYKAIKAYCKRRKLALWVHSAYITTGMWNINEDTKGDPKAKAIISLIKDQLIACNHLGANGLVIHLPKKHWNVVVGTLKILAPMLNKFKTPLLFEMTAVLAHPEFTYETPEKLNRLCDAIMDEIPDYENWGICPDTAHLWGAGVDVDDQKTMKSWFANMKYPYKIGLIHLNGSGVKNFSAGKDKHEIVFSDEDDIWNPDYSIDDELDLVAIKKSSIYTILKFAKKHKLSIICEINRGTAEDVMLSIDALKKILKS